MKKIIFSAIVLMSAGMMHAQDVINHAVNRDFTVNQALITPMNLEEKLEWTSRQIRSR